MLKLLENPRVVKALQMLGYALFFVAVVGFMLPYTFPKRQLVSFVARQARAQGYPVHIESLDLGWFHGLSLTNIRVTLPAKAGEPGENGAAGPGVPETELQISGLRAKVALWPALLGRSVEVSFDMEAGGGKLEGAKFVRKGEDFDIDLGKLDGLDLAEIGLGGRLLHGNKSLNADIEGALGGSAHVHVGKGGEEMSGDVDLELADAMLKSPELEGGLRMTDLGLGTVTLKVKMGLKSSIAALAAARGAETATVIHIEKMEADGGDVELLTDDTAHILIPPGKGGWKQATIQLHFAINLSEKDKAGKKDAKKDGKKDAAAKKAEAADADEESDGEDGEKEDKPVDDRAKWSKLLTMFEAKLKPFERAGYIGIGCTGPLMRPQCKPELPVPTVGTRSKIPGTPEGAPKVDAAPGTPVTTPGPVQPPVNVATPVIPAAVPFQPQPTPTPVAPPPEPAKPIEEKKPEEKKPEEPKVEEKKAEDEEPRGRGRNARQRDDAENEDESPRARRARPADDEEDDRPRRKVRDDDGPAEGDGEPADERQ